jgi:amidohydrolase
MLQQLYARLEAIYPELVAFRRDMHRFPELSHEEVETPAKIAAYLSALGLEVRTGVGGRGVVGKLRGGKPGKTVALRADFDALPIHDEKEVEYKSQVAGVMHACGHDIHTAGLLGVAKVLSEHREKIAGTVVFIHQFGEEKQPGGARPMVADGCLDGVDVIYGVHVSSELPIGKVGITPGYATAASARFDIEIQGKGGHGAAPHIAIDSVIVGSQLALNLQQIVSRKVDPLKPAVLTIGTFQAGTGMGATIADTAKLIGTVRTYDSDVQDFIEEEMSRIIKATCELSGASARFSYKRGYPATWNHPEEAARVERAIRETIGQEKVIRMEPMMGAEDFSIYAQEIPGVFFFVGARNPEQNAIYPHHHPKFDVDERAMLVAGKCFISAVFDFLADGDADRHG